ncbi:ERF family protein [Tomitella gaofuii]|uniref:ERF family protein n=1 Tax=Tomitella gaofuii TaxID=2760083 RepID=UPI0015FC4863|nr:ERF family protein [Tomitella gaofuii]
MKVAELLPLVSKEIGAVRKDGYNSGQKFNFRGIDAVVNACHSALAAHGVAVTPEVRSVEYVPIVFGKNKTAATSVRVMVAYTFHGPEDALTVMVAAEGNDMADKGTAKAMSVALRTALLQTLMLPTDEPDPDEDYDVQEPEHVGLIADAVALLKAKGIGPDEAADEFAAIGGEGKISECADVVLLRDFIETIKGA